MPFVLHFKEENPTMINSKTYTKRIGALIVHKQPKTYYLIFQKNYLFSKPESGNTSIFISNMLLGEVRIISELPHFQSPKPFKTCPF